MFNQSPFSFNEQSSMLLAAFTYRVRHKIFLEHGLITVSYRDKIIMVHHYPITLYLLYLIHIHNI